MIVIFIECYKISSIIWLQGFLLANSTWNKIVILFYLIRNFLTWYLDYIFNVYCCKSHFDKFYSKKNIQWCLNVISILYFYNTLGTVLETSQWVLICVITNGIRALIIKFSTAINKWMSVNYFIICCLHKIIKRSNNVYLHTIDGVA